MTDILDQIRDEVATFAPATAEAHAKVLRDVTTRTLSRLSGSEVIEHWLDAGLPNADRDEYPFGSIPRQIRRAMEVYVLENIEFSAPVTGFLVEAWVEGGDIPAAVLGPEKTLIKATTAALAVVSTGTMENLLRAMEGSGYDAIQLYCREGDISKVVISCYDDDGTHRWSEKFL